MSECKYCHKPVKQTPGKKKKDFCNNTCRSNFWYGKNKKGKSKLGVIKEAAIRMGKEVVAVNSNANKIAEHEKELASLGKSYIANQRRKWLLKQIDLIKSNSKDNR